MSLIVPILGWSFRGVLLIALCGCNPISTVKPSDLNSIRLVDFPPKADNGMPDEKLRLEQTAETCGGTHQGRIWEVRNVDALDRTITYHVQVDSNHAQSQYPQWITQTVKAGSFKKIPLCDTDQNSGQTVSFSLGGGGWGIDPAWPVPAGTTAQQAALLIQTRERVTWLINRNHQHSITVVYQLAGQNRETLRLEALAYQSVGSVEGVIHSAIYSDR